MGLLRDDIGYALDIELRITLPGLSREQAQHLIDEAHKVCPYSRALSGNVAVRPGADAFSLTMMVPPMTAPAATTAGSESASVRALSSTCCW